LRGLPAGAEPAVLKRQREHVPDPEITGRVRARAIAISASDASSPHTWAPRPAAALAA
jgi:hypothetical protein